MATKELIYPAEDGQHLPLSNARDRALGPARLLIKTGINNFILFGWGLWTLLSLSLFILSGSSTDVLVTYFLYLMVGAIGLWRTRKDILAPTGAFVLVAFSGFGLNIPLIATGQISFLHIDDGTLTKVISIVLFAQVGFICGSMVPNMKFNPIRRIVGANYSIRGTSIAAFVGLLLVQICAAVIRKELHLGEAGIQPSIPYAGVFQFFLYQGLLILCVWYLAQGLTQKRTHAILGLILLIGMALSQALLGWRGGIMYVIIIAAVPFWYQFKLSDKQKHYSMGWLMILILLSSSIIQMGSAIRTERLGGESGFSKSDEQFMTNVLVRSQGTTRLAEVTKYFGPLSSTNNFLLEKLLSQDISATIYIDRTVYGIAPNQSHSVGTSGPGGPYTAAGVMGVIGSYFLIGIFYQLSYFSITNFETSSVNVLGVVWYAFLILMLFEILNENFSTNSLKMYFAVLTQIYLFKHLLKGRPVR